MEEPDFVPPPPSKVGHQATTEVFTTVLHGKGCLVGFAIKGFKLARCAKRDAYFEASEPRSRHTISNLKMFEEFL